MQNFRILILEDEILIADTIKRYLTQKGHEIVGVAISYEEAEELYLQTMPDIALLDIRLSGSKTGIDFGKFIQQQTQPQPFIYLTSQWDSRSISNAKKTFPAGYLSKPIQKNTLYATIEIAMHSHNHSIPEEEVSTITLYDGARNHVISINDILYLQADHIYVKIYLTQGEFILQRTTLKNILQQLPSDQFIQTHRSFAVNVKFVTHWDNQLLCIEDKTIPISRARKKMVLSSLKI